MQLSIFLLVFGIFYLFQGRKYYLTERLQEAKMWASFGIQYGIPLAELSLCALIVGPPKLGLPIGDLIFYLIVLVHGMATGAGFAYAIDRQTVLWEPIFTLNTTLILFSSVCFALGSYIH
jgi:hypothetical protein